MENFKAETTGIIFILLSYKLLYQYINCKEQVISFLVPLFCIIFLACRFDDILAAIPLIILFFSKFKNKNKNIINSKKYFNYICQSGIIIILCIVFIYIPNKTTRYISHRETSFMTWDLIGIHLNADIQSFMIGDIKINMDEKKKYYNTYNGDAYWWGDNISSITPGLSITYWDKSLVDSTRNKWFESIIQYPFAYLKHRLKIAYLFFFDRSWYLEDENTHHNGKFVTRIVDQVQLKIPYSERRYDYKKLYWKFRFDNLWIHGIYIISSIIFTLFLYIFYKYATHTIYKFQFALFLLLSLLCTSLKVIFIPAVHFRYGLWMPIASILIFSILLDNLLYYSTKKFIKRIDIINHR
jgi:hypothetical protein